MNSIASLISLLQYVRQLDADFRLIKSSLPAEEVTKIETRLTDLLNQAAADLKKVGKLIVGQDIPSGQGEG